MAVKISNWSTFDHYVCNDIIKKLKEFTLKYLLIYDIKTLAKFMCLIKKQTFFNKVIMYFLS